MFAFLTTSLGRNILIGLAGVLALAALTWGAHKLYQDVKQSGRDEIQARWDAEKAGAEKARADLSDALTEAFAGLDGSLQSFAKTITVKGQQITVRVKKEMDNDPRYSSDECSVDGRVLDSINAARSLSHPATASGSNSNAVPTGGYPVRVELGDTGTR